MEWNTEPEPSINTPWNTLADMDPYQYLKIKTHMLLIEAMEESDLINCDPTLLRSSIKQAVRQLMRTGENIDPGDKERLAEDVYNETLKYGPLEPLLADKTISDILVNGFDRFFLERQGKLEEIPVRFKSNRHLILVIERIVAMFGRRVDESQPICDARMPDGSRFHCVIPPLALDGPLVSIRKFVGTAYTLEDLIRLDTINDVVATLLQSYVKARLNIVVSGGTGAGKTTLLNALSSAIPENERVVTIEDPAELQLQKRNLARMEVRPANIEGSGEVTQSELFRNALRMRPDRIIVGECRAGECFDMLQAMNTGHDGSITTLHANNARDALRRMETMVLMAGYDLSPLAIRQQIASCIDIIIQLTRLNDGNRVITSITDIVGMESEVILLHETFKYSPTKTIKKDVIPGGLRFTGGHSRSLELLQEAGIEVNLEALRSMSDTHH
jgi:pilus assembly protein CpaF